MARNIPTTAKVLCVKHIDEIVRAKTQDPVQSEKWREIGLWIKLR
jgi:hypothetical protein